METVRLMDSFQDIEPVFSRSIVEKGLPATLNSFEFKGVEYRVEEIRQRNGDTIYLPRVQNLPEIRTSPNTLSRRLSRLLAQLVRLFHLRADEGTYRGQSGGTPAVIPDTEETLRRYAVFLNDPEIKLNNLRFHVMHQIHAMHLEYAAVSSREHSVLCERLLSLASKPVHWHCESPIPCVKALCNKYYRSVLLRGKEATHERFIVDGVPMSISQKDDAHFEVKLLFSGNDALTGAEGLEAAKNLAAKVEKMLNEKYASIGGKIERAKRLHIEVFTTEPLPMFLVMGNQVYTNSMMLRLTFDDRLSFTADQKTAHTETVAKTLAEAGTIAEAKVMLKTIIDTGSVPGLKLDVSALQVKVEFFGETVAEQQTDDLIDRLISESITIGFATQEPIQWKIIKSPLLSLVHNVAQMRTSEPVTALNMLTAIKAEISEDAYVQLRFAEFEQSLRTDSSEPLPNCTEADDKTNEEETGEQTKDEAVNEGTAVHLNFADADEPYHYDDSQSNYDYDRESESEL